MIQTTDDFERSVLMAQIAQKHGNYEDMSNFLSPILYQRKVFISIETRMLIEAAFHGLVEEKRDAIRKLKKIGNDSNFHGFHNATERYLMKLRQELAYDCQKIILMCEKVLSKTDDYDD